MSHINLYDAENVADLLKGVYPVMISQYYYSEPLPTATDRVMKEYIYVILNTNKTIDKNSSHNPYMQDYARFFV